MEDKGMTDEELKAQDELYTKITGVKHPLKGAQIQRTDKFKNIVKLSSKWNYYSMTALSDLHLKESQKVCDIMAEGGDCSCKKVLPEGDYVVVSICAFDEYKKYCNKAIDDFHQFEVPELECETDDGSLRLLFYKML